MYKILISGLLIGFSFSLIACNLLTVNDSASDYPTTYPSINFAELEQMNAEYQAANNGRICSTLNEYGFTGYSEIFFVDGESPCKNREIVRVEMTNTDTLETVAKKVLLKNSIYTGVEDTSQLVLRRMEPLPGCTICEGPDENRVNIEYKLTFHNQEIDTVEVWNTEITVFIDAKGVNRIWGNWYSDFNIPDFVNYGYKEVQEGMVGWKIDMRTYTGEQVIYTIKEEDLTEKPRKVHVPVESENEAALELRTCWLVPVNYGGQNFEGWNALIDVKEGFLVMLDAK